MAYNKKQHTVQKAYLEQWKINGEFFVYDLKSKKVHQGDPKKIFRENYIYNWDDFDGKEKFIIDEAITEIENNALPVIKKIQKEPISDDEKYALAQYIALQTMRTPRTKEAFHELSIAISKNTLIEQLKNPKKKAELLKGMPIKGQKLIEELSDDPEKSVNELFNEKVIIKIKNIREIWLQTSLKMLKDLTESNYNSSWCLFSAGKNKAFITSDNPVVTISSTNKAENATKENINFTEVAFPLSPKHILLIKKNMRFPQKRILRKKTTENQESIKEFNWRTATFSDRFIVSHSDRLLIKVGEMAYSDWANIRNDKMRFEQQSKGYIHTHTETKNKSVRLISRKF